MVIKYLKENEKTTRWVISIILTFILSILGIFLYQWFTNLLDSSTLSDGEIQIIIILIAGILIILFSIIIIFIELKEMKKEIIQIINQKSKDKK